jgi:AcrR family transcriptional regulator
MPRPRSDIAPRILHAARARFLEDGVSGASLRGIAQDAGTSIGMIYYYFPTKDDLFLAVVEEVYAKILADFEVALAAGAPVEERLRRLFERVARMSDDELTVVRIVIREGLVSSERRGRIVERFSRGHLPLVLATLAEGVSTGALRGDLPPPALVVSTFVLGFLPQVVRRLIGDGLPFAALLPSGEAFAKVLAEILLHGIAAPATGTKPGVPPMSG